MTLTPLSIIKTNEDVSLIEVRSWDKPGIAYSFWFPNSNEMQIREH